MLHSVCSEGELLAVVSAFGISVFERCMQQPRRQRTATLRDVTRCHNTNNRDVLWIGLVSGIIDSPLARRRTRDPMSLAEMPQDYNTGLYKRNSSG